MRFDAIELFRFGAFEHLRVDLAGGDRGLHVIHGTNEAGKSTLLRAVRGFLFDIDERSTDTHTFESSKLRVAAVVRGEDGSTHELMRRKGRKDTLLVHEGEGAGKTVFPEVEFRRLCTLDQESFDHLFGLDDESLRKDAERLLAEDGPLGRVLFAASIGASRLQELDASLAEEIDELWKTNGRNQRLAILLKQHEELRKKARESALGADEYEAVVEELERAETKLEEIDQTRSEVARRLAVLDRVGQALEPWMRRRTLLEQRGELGELPETRADFLELLDERDDEIAGLETELLKVSRAVEDRQASIASSSPTEEQLSLLEQRDRLQAFERRLDGVSESLDRLPIQGLAELSDQESVHGAGADRIADLQAIRTEHAQAVTFEEAREKAQLAREKRASQCEQLRGDLGGAIRERATDPDLQARIQRSVDEARAFGHPDAALLEESSALQIEEQGLVDRWKALDGSGEDLLRLTSLQLPGLEVTAELFEREQAQVQQIESLRADLQDRERQLREAEAELRGLEVGRAIPRPEELDDLRRSRDAGWRAIRGRWLGGDPADAEAHSELGDEELADRHEQALSASDALSDELRVEADSVQKRLLLQLSIEGHERERDTLVEKIAEAEAGRATALDELRALAAPVCRASASAIEIQERIAQLHELRAELLDHETRKRGLAARLEQRATLRASLIDTASLSDSSSDALEPVLGAAERILEVIEKLRGAEQELADAERELQSQSERVTESRARLDRLSAALGLEPGVSLAALPAAVGRIASEVEQLGDRHRLRAFRDEVGAWFAEAFPSGMFDSLDPTRADECIEALSTRLQDALSVASRLQSHEVELEREQREVQRVSADLDRARDARLGLLKPVFEPLGVALDDDEQVLGWIDRLRRAADLDGAVAQCDELIQTAARGFDRTQLIASLEDAEADQIEAERGGLERRVVELDDERARAIEARVGAQDRLAQLQAQSDAVEVEQELADVEQAILADVERLRALETARALLARRIEEYRREHQGPVLERASALLGRLTGGRYPELRTDWNDRDELGLFAVDASGGMLAPSALSSGTRDQLFLALKLATIGALIDGGETAPLPVLLDDVFVHFDDDRSLEGLRILAELSRSTQVLFFTHHRRLFESAEELAAEGLDVHPLSLPGAKEPQVTRT